MSVRQLSVRKTKGNSLHQVVHSIIEQLEERRLLSGDIRLIGITGNQDSGDTGFGNDETLYDIKVASAGTTDPTFLDGWEDITANPPDTKLSISDTIGVSQGHGALRVDVDNGVGAFWGIRSPNVVDLLRNGATVLSYDMTLLNKELNGGAYGGNGDDSFNGYAQNNELAISINTPSGGFIQRSFSQANASDSLNTSATWSGVDGTRNINWDLTTFTSQSGQSLQEFITANNATDARIWLVTQGKDDNGHVGPMRFYFDNIQLVDPINGVTTIGDFELMNISKIIQLPHVPDTDSIAFNPQTGLLPPISGSSSYRNNPARIGYRDDQFMETINMDDPVNSQVGVFNANYEGGPIFDNQPETMNYGLPAPFPNRVLPDPRRPDDEPDPSFSTRGPDEWASMRDFTWSNADQLFYGTDGSGIYKLTADGQSTFLGFPAGMNDPKGITFWNNNGVRKLLVTERDGPNMYTIDPATGQPVGDPVVLVDASNNPIPGVVSIVEDPTSNMLLGIAKSVFASGDANSRELIRIDPTTGQT